MNRSIRETSLAWFSIVSAVFHFVFETLYHLRFGQFLPMLIVDYIAVSLLLYGGVLSLRVRPESAAGLLCGAWGFTFCLAYRTFFWRLEDLLKGLGQRGEEPDALVWVLGALLAISVAAFLFSFRLAHPGKAAIRRVGAQRGVSES